MNDARVLDTVRDALRADRIDIYLQPIVSLPQRKHRFYEVFSRVRAADGQQIMPDRYLAIAGREGLIATIDNLLLVRCIQLIRETERRQHAIGFFSNISAATLSDAEFMKHFLKMMAQNQALVPKLVFELGQADLRAGGAVTMGILQQLARLGFHFSMDQVTDLDLDIESLQRHEFRYVKLDRALVLDPALTDRVIDLRRRLGAEGIDLIVEKIETETQLVEILDIGFDFGQGFLFGEPRLSRKPG
ncbi:EAL domain-containing protein [Azospirillum thermophilum]|uniref:EAL domain-containing protein n=1 Tax=Azospirillum thermophilum TaxID=2202148 RepID=UPI001FED1A67|nr:EAL domain-containing protein [Azospirillum thermophilum]